MPKEITTQELNSIQASWLKQKILYYGTKCAKVYFKIQSKINPDARQIVKYLNTFIIK